MSKTTVSRSEKRVLFAPVFLLLLASCASSRGGREPTLAEVRTWPSKKASTYSGDIAATLAAGVESRMGAAPAALLDNLRQADGDPSYASYSPSDADRSLFSEYFSLLPSRFRAVMEAELLGIYFIEGFAGGGMTDFVLDGGSMYLILVLNPAVLKLGLSEWIAYRDISPYEDDGKGVELRSACAGGEGYKGLLHTLTHEAAHIYDHYGRATPFVEPLLAGSSDLPAGKDFTRGVWTSYAQPAPNYAIPGLGELRPYGLGKRLPLSTAAAQYAALSKTPFSSLYGALSWAEDFAETATWRWLGARLGVGYEVIIARGGREAARFEAGAWPEPEARTAALRSVLD